GTGVASGENRAVEAAQRAISSPLLEESSIEGARGVLINITGGPDLTLFEVNEAASIIHDAAHEDAQIIFGSVIDENMSEEVRVTVIATGFGYQEEKAKPKEQELKPVAVSQPELEEVSATNHHSPFFKRRFSKRKDEVPYSHFDEKSLDVPTFIRRQLE
ncbi:MAG: cell division protein FtsZ, partial [Nitrospinota bacterium]